MLDSNPDSVQNREVKVAIVPANPLPSIHMMNGQPHRDAVNNIIASLTQNYCEIMSVQYAIYHDGNPYYLITYRQHQIPARQTRRGGM